MGLSDKIKEINKKPEHIRIRYAWIFSFVITFFVVILWAVSLMTQKNENTAGPIMPDTSSIANDLSQQKNAIQNAAGNLQNSLDTGSDPSAIQDNSAIDQSTNPPPDGTDSLYDNSANNSTTTDGTDGLGGLPVDNSTDSSVTTPSDNSATQVNNNPTASPAQNSAAPKNSTGKEGFKAQ